MHLGGASGWHAARPPTRYWRKVNGSFISLMGHPANVCYSKRRYSIISLLFFVPYIILELPSNIALRKLGARYWLSAIVTLFGAVMIGMAFVTDWKQLAACRVLLGALEAGFFPAVSV